ncbi:hypothetical protein [Streptomyces sp. NBC_00102]|uniref:hypothetical protein n=1 Tax=Streptomyces sp. NBC_00102 TaxID=2975652 RepID=UPI00224F26E9|nr:hypothetical protein [Streptomyces sp. NBC_00102]MCX5399641.1 hypothetical protein [Streptomyces sp. NBC_00102]
MNTLLNLLGVTVLAALVLLPALLGFARERRISRELRTAALDRDARRADPPDPVTADRTRPAARRPYVRSWARI